ncbi:MAG: transcriptional repressor LexA [Elusimicrobiota bacterium]|nr:transcriptional repressor LexA [Elusimicrobiota bacterium]
MYEDLTPQQRKVLEFISTYIRSIGMPPTIREVGKKLKFSSTGTVRYYLRGLSEKGYIKLKGKISRGIELIKQFKGIPILRRVSAGKPLEAIENIEGSLNFDQFFPSDKNLFVLRAKGDSMIGEGIKENDFLVVKQQQVANDGDIVVAMVDGKAVIKKFYKDKNNIRLKAANPKYSPVVSRNVEIVGKVIGVVRKLSKI